MARLVPIVTTEVAGVPPTSSVPAVCPVLPETPGTRDMSLPLMVTLPMIPPWALYSQPC